MTETPVPTLSVQTQASVQGVMRAKADLVQWIKNLEQALADDVAANPPRLEHDQAAEIAKTYGVQAPPAPPKKAAHEEEHHHKAEHEEHPAPPPEPPSAKPEADEPKAHEDKAKDDKDDKAKKPAR